MATATTWIKDLLSGKKKKEKQKKELIRSLSQSILHHYQGEDRVNLISIIKEQPGDVLLHIEDLLPNLILIYSLKKGSTIPNPDTRTLATEVFTCLIRQLIEELQPSG
ncbi:MAG TPA: hypothetical protein VI752_00565 [Candidatus Paceibacterota bacterium]|jgi:hypothetical protein